MTPSREKTSSHSHSNMKVVKGRKLERKRQSRSFSIFVAGLLVVVLILQLIFPAGIFETVTNSLTLLGSGTYPIELNSTETINAVSYGNYYYVLTNSFISAYNSTGKELFSYPHGFEKPIIKTSSSRALLFNQGKNNALIFNNSGLKETITTEKEILTGAISDSGVYALVTLSDKYASAVSVYSKRNNVLYEWFSAENTINNVAISPNGKKIAVSGFNSGVGKYKSEVNVLNFKSPNPEFTDTFDGNLIYGLDTSSAKGFTVITSNKIKFIKWYKQKSETHENDYNIAFYKGGKSGAVAVFNRENDKTDNRIEVYNKSGKLKNKIEFKGTISDIQLFGNHIYCMSDTEIFLLGEEGKILRNASCGFGVVKFVVTGTNNVVAITDNEIEKIKLKQEE